VLKGSTRIVDPGPSFRMRRLWRLWRHDCDDRVK